MMKIYFDETLIDEDFYGGLTKTGVVFDNSFKLGSTICEQYDLVLSKEANVEIPNIVKVRDESRNIFNGYAWTPATMSSGVPSGTTGRVEMLTNESNSFSFNRDRTGSYVGVYSKLTRLKANTTYTISYDISYECSVATNLFYSDLCSYVNGTYTRVYNVGGKTSETKIEYQYTPTEDIDVCVVGYIANTGVYTNAGLYNIQIEEGTEKTDFVPYVNETLKTLYVDDFNNEDDYVDKYTLVDGMIKFNFPYDASHLMGEDGETTLRDILIDICLTAGIQSNIDEFDYSDMKVSWYDNTFLARDYLGYIAELNCKNLYITGDNKLDFKDLTTKKEITFDEISDFKIGKEHKITKVVWDDTENLWQFGDDTGETYFIDTNNVYLISETQVQDIFNKINGFTYYNFKTSNLPISDCLTGDVVLFKNGDLEYKSFIQYQNLNFSGNSWFGGSEISVENTDQETTELIGNVEKMRRIKVTVDRENNLIRQEVSETNSRIDSVEIDSNNNYQELLQKFDDVVSNEDFQSYKTTMQTELTATQYQIANIQKAVVDGVNYVKTTSGTFDENGLTMEQTGASTKTILNQDGVDVKDVQGSSGEDLLYAGYVSTQKATDNEELKAYEGQSVVYTKNSIVKNYLVIGNYSRIEDYEDGTGIFYLG